MPRSRMIGIMVIVFVGVAAVVALTVALTPGAIHPAFAAATDFMNAAGKGNDAAASALLSDNMLAYVAGNCPAGSVSACIASYIPPEWGNLQSAVFRRAAPDEQNWNVELIATYEKDTGASGVCSFFRMEQDAAGVWRVYGWAGFLWCGDGRSRSMATNPDTPNRVP